MHHKEEKLGEIFILSQAIFYGLFPVLINYAVKSMPPLFFAGLSTIMASLLIFPYFIATKKIKSIFNKKALKYILGVTVFISIIPSILIFIGTKFTSGLNTALLLQFEIISTFLICGWLKFETITKRKIIGAVIVTIGAMAILYNGNFVVNIGDILIIVATFFYPFGNIFAIKALKLVSPAVILGMRSFLAGLFLLAISFAFEGNMLDFIVSVQKNIWIILVNGILLMFISKILWYEGLKRIGLTKSASIGNSAPAFSLLFAIFWLHEIPTMYQAAGFLLVMVGLYVSTRKPRIPQTPA
jgi:drug/metabolite transporter (DMT)-like permease